MFLECTAVLMIGPSSLEEQFGHKILLLRSSMTQNLVLLETLL